MYGVARLSAQRFLTRRCRVRWTESTGNSRRITPISYGYRTSPMFPPGRVGCMSRSSSTCLPGASWVGGSVPACTRISCWMRWSKGYTEWLAEAGIEPLMGNRGDSYDFPLTKTINRLYKAELIHIRGPWKIRESVELGVLVQSTAFAGTYRLYTASRS